MRSRKDLFTLMRCTLEEIEVKDEEQEALMEELLFFIDKEILSLEKRLIRDREKREIKDEIKRSVIDVLEDQYAEDEEVYLTVDKVHEELSKDFDNLTIAQVRSRLSRLVDDEVAEKKKITIDGKRKMVYRKKVDEEGCADCLIVDDPTITE